MSAPTWSADGASIAFGRFRAGGLVDLWVMSADGSDARRVVDSKEVGGTIAQPTWSPGGRFVAFAVDSDGDSSLWEWDSDLEGDSKSNPERLWSGAGTAWNPQWIEGGAQIAFLQRSVVRTNLVAVRFDGLDAPVHVEDQDGPDGTQPVVVGSGRPRVLVSDLPGGGVLVPATAGGRLGGMPRSRPGSVYLVCRGDSAGCRLAASGQRRLSEARAGVPPAGRRRPMGVGDCLQRGRELARSAARRRPAVRADRLRGRR